MKRSFFETRFQGWTGEKCDRRVCTESCQNGGILAESCFCFCPDGYWGELCENTPCTTQPCVNGQCSVNGSSYECTCADNWTGVHCDIFVAPGPCESDPCIQGKTLPQFLFFLTNFKVNASNREVIISVFATVIGPAKIVTLLSHHHLAHPNPVFKVKVFRRTHLRKLTLRLSDEAQESHLVKECHQHQI